MAREFTWIDNDFAWNWFQFKTNWFFKNWKTIQIKIHLLPLSEFKLNAFQIYLNINNFIFKFKPEYTDFEIVSLKSGTSIEYLFN